MKIQDFLAHHGIRRNPFAEEEAQTDPVFKENCIEQTYHPVWDKVFGDPSEPATSIVFGEKGAGKTAMRLQIARQIEIYNREHHNQRIALVHYDDFNPFLDRFASRFPHRMKPEKLLARFQLWDHMDALLSIMTTGLIDRLLESPRPSAHVDLEANARNAADLDPHQSRDLLLLAALYDTSSAETYKGRWHRLRRRTSYFSIKAFWDWGFGVLWTIGLVAVMIGLKSSGAVTSYDPFWLYLILFAVGWLPRLGRMLHGGWKAWRIVRQIKTGKHRVNALRQVLSWFGPADLSGQPIPTLDRTEDRYELLEKLLAIFAAMKYRGSIVVVDRVDEPHVINGQVKRIKAFVWPLLDNKFLKLPNIGFKLMLPAELKPFIDREEEEFHQRARLDKQNVIPSFEWTGEALYDLTNDRMRACAEDGKSPQLRDLFDERVSDARLLEAMRSLRVPRHLFKFLYRLMVAHCNAHTTDTPAWKISSDMFEANYAVFMSAPGGQGA